MKKLLFIAIIAMTTTVQAAEVCTTLDVSGWTQEQKNMISAVAYRLAWEADSSMHGPSSVNKNTGDVCFTDPSIDVANTITTAAVVAKYNELKAESDAANQAAEMEREAYATEVGGNNLCDATLEQIGSVIDAKRTAFQTQIDNAKANIQTDIDATNNVAAARTAMTTMNNTYSAGFGLLADDLVTVTKQIGRCLKARSALGGF